MKKHKKISLEAKIALTIGIIQILLQVISLLKN